MGMMAVAAAGIRGGFMQMSNGANLAFEKKAFETVKGYEGHEHLASGDDMLLMEKIAKRYPKQLGFLKQLQAQTKTKPPQGVSAFVDQRIRWASKSSSYSSWQVKFILLMVWLLCLSILMDAVLVFWNSSFLYLVIFKLVLKALADFYFLNTMAVFFKRKSLMKAFVPSFFFSLYLYNFDWIFGQSSKRIPLERQKNKINKDLCKLGLFKKTGYLKLSLLAKPIVYFAMSFMLFLSFLLASCQWLLCSKSLKLQRNL